MLDCSSHEPGRPLVSCPGFLLLNRLEQPALPAVDHELLLGDGPVVVDVHHAEHGVCELLRLLLAVLAGEQAQDGRDDLEGEGEEEKSIETDLLDLCPLYQTVLGEVVQLEGPPDLLFQRLVGEV